MNLQLSERQKLWLLAGLLFTFHAIFLLNYPAVSDDEGFYGLASKRVWGLLDGSYPYPVQSAYLHFLLPFGRFFLIADGIWQRFSGSGYYSLRLFGLLGWIVTYFGVHRLVKLVLNQWAILSAVIFSFAWMPLYYGHNARPHIWVTAWAVWYIAFCLQIWVKERKSPWIYFQAGLGLLIGVEIHFIAGCIAIGTFIIFGWQALRQSDYKNWAWYFAGCLTAVFIYGTLLLIPAPKIAIDRFFHDSPLKILSYYSSSNANGKIGGNPFTNLNILREIKLYGTWWLSHYMYREGLWGLPQGILFGFGILYALFTKNKKLQLLFWLYFLSSIIVFGLLIELKQSAYALVWYPLLLVLGISSLDQILQKLKLNFLIIPALAGFCLLFFVGTIHLLSSNYQRVLPEIRRVADNISGGRVIGPLVFWPAMPDLEFWDEVLLPIYADSVDIPVGEYIPENSIFDVFSAPFIQEHHIRYVLLDDTFGNTFSGNYSQQASFLDTVTREACTLISTHPFDLPDFGSLRTTRLYQCDSK
jgi:hypothetical protein